MAKRIRESPEQIITKLREAEVYRSQGKTLGQACMTLEISEQTYYRWRREYGGMDFTQARKLKEMEKENARLKKLVINAAIRTLHQALEYPPENADGEFMIIRPMLPVELFAGANEKRPSKSDR